MLLVARLAAVGIAIIFTVHHTSCLRLDETSQQTTEPTVTIEPQESNRQLPSAATQDYAQDRDKLVTKNLAGRDIVNQNVLKVMRKVPRHLFVPEEMKEYAYYDQALPIGQGQTISQPYIVALMTQLVDPQPQHKALDVGTGSGYQAAVLAELVKDVYSIEIVEDLANQARDRLRGMGYKNIIVRHGDGYAGWPSEAPFDVIIVAATPDHIPPALVEQLAPGGKLVIPVNERLLVVEKKQDGSVVKRKSIPVRFVPMTGKAEKK